ncbi:MAG: hypothetical protein JWR75_53 [Devosia sp.]|nr:hypothetical protein [Devosia sp.]
MKRQIRLLPVVLLAGLALLAFKSIGLVTQGGYVLTGPGIAMAETAAPAADHAAPAADGTSEGEATFADTPTMTDAAPTLQDTAPTLGNGDAAEGSHGAPAVEGEAAVAEGEHADPAADAAHAETVATADGTAKCAIELAATPSESAAAEVSETEPPCVPLVDAVPMMEDGNGNIVPLASGADTPTEQILLERLGERRAELDTREAELAIRASLVDAAEQRLEARSAALADVEAQIAALVEQRQALEDEQFKTIVGLYENMKPQEASAIFDKLDMGILLRIAQSMNPRKMAPILAKMSPDVAQVLTVNLAMPQVAIAEPPPSGDLGALPQIVGQ